MLHANVKKIFTPHPPFGSQQERYDRLDEVALTLACYVNDFCPESREQTLAITRLQEAVLLAKAAIANNETPIEHEKTPWSDGKPTTRMVEEGVIT